MSAVAPGMASLWRIRALRSLSVAWMLAEREVVAEYRASRMSLAWPLIFPIAYTALFVVLRPALTDSKGPGGWTYVAFVFVGFSLWQAWFEAMRTQMDAVRRNKSMLSRGELGSATLCSAVTIVAGLHMAPRLVVAVFLGCVVFPISPLDVLGFLVLSVILLLNGSAIGAVLQPFSTLSPDLGKAVQSISLGLLVTAAVFIPMTPQSPATLKAVVAINPVGALLNAARALLMHQPMLLPVASGVWIVLTFGLTALVLVMGRRMLPILIERIGN